MAKLKFRKATLNDINELVELRIIFLKEAQKIKGNKKDARLRKVLKNYFSNKIKKGEFVSWLAIKNNKIIATSGLSFYSVPPYYTNSTGKAAYISNLYTKPNFRKKGIATSLFKKIMTEVKKAGVGEIILHATGSGINLYKKFGFEKENQEMVSYLGN